MIIKFQSTHPRGVRHAKPCYVRYGKLPVSIHAPAWGATPVCCLAGERGWPCFNPRTRVGCDPHGRPSPAGSRRFQSTHPRGVRHRIIIDAPVDVPGFNPRTRVGCDTDARQASPIKIRVSIHAPAWGATPAPDQRQAAEGRVSIHAPAWGATRAGERLSPFLFLVSIHAPAWGATRRGHSAGPPPG